MKFKVGNRVKYIKDYSQTVGDCGVITRMKGKGAVVKWDEHGETNLEMGAILLIVSRNYHARAS